MQPSAGADVVVNMANNCKAEDLQLGARRALDESRRLIAETRLAVRQSRELIHKTRRLLTESSARQATGGRALAGTPSGGADPAAALAPNRAPPVSAAGPVVTKRRGCPR